MPTQIEIEQALDSGRLWVHGGRGFWVLRRNGRTQTWKTRQGHFRLPVKAGLKSTGAIDHDTYVHHFGDVGWQSASFVICDHNPADGRAAAKRELAAIVPLA